MPHEHSSPTQHVGSAAEEAGKDTSASEEQSESWEPQVYL